MKFSYSINVIATRVCTKNNNHCNLEYFYELLLLPPRMFILLCFFVFVVFFRCDNSCLWCRWYNLWLFLTFIITITTKIIIIIINVTAIPHVYTSIIISITIANDCCIFTIVHSIAIYVCFFVIVSCSYTCCSSFFSLHSYYHKNCCN